VPTLIKLLWLQRIFFRTEFLHLGDQAASADSGKRLGERLAETANATRVTAMCDTARAACAAGYGGSSCTTDIDESCAVLLHAAENATDAGITTHDTAALSAVGKSALDAGSSSGSMVAAVGDEVVSWWWLIMLVVSLLLMVSFKINANLLHEKDKERTLRKQRKTLPDGKRKKRLLEAKGPVPGEPVREGAAAT
jgi:hypothetical protein